jgi:large subunit ribosomal protein L2
MVTFLRFFRKSTAGRNNQGRITSRHRGGRRRIAVYNYTNYLFFKGRSPLSVMTDRFRAMFVIPIPGLRGPIYEFFRLRAYSYASTPVFLRPNHYSSDFSLVPLFKVPVGQYISNVADRAPGPKFARAYGSAAQLLRIRGSFATVRLPSGEVRKIFAGSFCIPTRIYKDFKSIKLYKAGQSRWLGRRPTVRGVAINPVDHPHGGRTGESRPSVSPWAILTKGYRTRTRPIDKKFVLVSVQQFKDKRRLL